MRVLRKRLRSWGLWPSRTETVATSPVIESLYEALRAAATPAIAPYLHPKHGYEAWQETNRFTAAAKRDLLETLAKAPELPKISILTPVFNTPEPHLRALVASISDQVYENWELCLSDDGSTRPETLAVLEEFESSMTRVRVIRSPENGGIAEATNAAAMIAVGDVFVFVDHDDLLTPDCLAEVALKFASEPGVDFVYSDDDKIDDDGRRYAPQFKPDFSPVLLLSFMYMSHIVGVRRALFEAVGGIRKGFEGSQDYDFALRATERANSVGHIPKILYHWRAAEGSTARSGDAKPASFGAGLKAISEALARRNIDATPVHPDWAKAARIGMFSLAFPDHGPSVTIIVPTYNNAHLLRDCIESLRATAYADYDVLIIDNGSDDPATLAYLEDVREQPRHSIVRIERRPAGFSFSALMNEAVRHVTSEFVLFLNNDTKILSPSWLSQMVGYGQIDAVGSVGARLYFSDGTLQHGGIVHGYHEGLVGHAFRAAAPHDWGYLSFVKAAREYSAVTAACMLTRRTLFESLGGFDETDFAVAYNDVDYGYRLAKQGMLNIYCPEAELFHYEGKTRSKKDNPKEVINFRSRYGAFNDAYYNPNLSLENERFEVDTRRAPCRSTAPIRACVVSHNLNFEGAPNTLFDLVVGLTRQGAIDPIVLAPGPGPLKQAYEEAGIEVRLFNAPPTGCSPADHRALTNALSELFKELGASVVVANTLPMFFAINAAHDAGIGAVWCQHESEPWETYFNAETPEVRTMAYAAFGQAYRVTYVAEATRRAWAPVQMRQNAQVIRHGIPPERVAEELARWTRASARDRLGLSDHDCVAILMGTVCSRKGQLDLVQALAAIDPVRPNLRVYIVGATTHDEAYAKQLEAALNALPAATRDRITVTGAVGDMTLYYAAADISVCTSRIESAPRVIVESMLFSLPIVTTPVFGIPELVDEDVNALFYRPGDTQALASLISRLVDNTEARQSLAADSRDVLFSKPGYKEMLAQYSSLVREAALTSSQSPPLHLPTKD
ncbi:Hyaluronan synthase [compost metagenome]